MASYSIGVVLFGIGIAATIALHELGHLLVARWCGMRVRRYFIGFGPKIWSMRKGHTEYGLKAIPLGGFCDIAGMTAQDEVTEEERPHAMWAKPAWQRIAVLSGGVAMNLLLGLAIIYGLAVTSGIPNPDADVRARVAETSCIANTCPARDAGIRHGDIIVALNEEPVSSFMELRDKVSTLAGQTVTIAVERDGSRREVTVPVATVGGRGVIGVVSEPPRDAVKSFGPVEAVGKSGQFAYQMIGSTVKGLAAFPGKVPGVVASILGGEREAEGPISVVGASRLGGEVVERSAWSIFWMMLASLNFFLALFNVVPLPPLDGGHIAVVLYEKLRDLIRGRKGEPVDYGPLMPLTMAVAALLMVVGALIIVADVVNPVRLFP